MKKFYVSLGVLMLFLFFITEVSLASTSTIKGNVSVKRSRKSYTILVYIEKVEGKIFTPPEKTIEMNQKNMLFIPKILPVVVGSTVVFRNSDKVKHSVFGVGDDRDADFNLGVWRYGRTKAYTFNKLGEVAILCNVHPEMEAYVVVLQNPYFSFTDKDGNYKIENVPAGTYNLKTWHDRVKPGRQEVVVPEEGEVEINFELKR